MKANIPLPSLSAALWQSALVICFGVCLYLFFAVSAEKDTYRQATEEQLQEYQNLQQTMETLSSRNQFVAGQPFFQKSSREIQWVKIDEVWTDLSADELLGRLARLYREDCPFVLESFAAVLAGTGETNPGAESSVTQSEQSDFGDWQEKLEFHLQGYFLCPYK